MTRPRRDEYAIALDEAQASEPIARRELLKLMGAALGLAGLAACTRAPDQAIVPYVVQPPEVTPGRPRFYATATTLDGYATGVLVESHEGRPTKVEGNPEHPVSRGASSVFDQASVLGLYDPSRARSNKARGSVASWIEVRSALTAGPWTGRRGRGLHVLLAPTSSPTTREQLRELRARWPEAQIHFHSATPRTNVWEGSRLVFGRVLEPLLDLTRADVIVALDSDFLAAGPGHLRLAREHAGMRTPRGAKSEMNRLYAFEPGYTATGASADHRLAVRAHDVQAIAAALLEAVGAPASLGPALSRLRERASAYDRFVQAVARDLTSHRGRSVVIAGDAQPPVVHALAHALNAALGNLGATVSLVASPILDAGGASHDLGVLTRALEGGTVDTLVVLGTNAVYTAPADVPLRALIGRARQSAYLGLYEDETSEACTFTIAAAHELESWGDALAEDGTETIVQPLIAPLFDGRTPIDVLALLADRPAGTSYDLVRARFAKERAAGRDAASFEALWNRALMRGVVDGTAFAAEAAPPSWTRLSDALATTRIPPADALEIVFPIDPRVHDGRFSNNAWLLELPSPITKLTWTNAATLAPETAAEHGLVTGDEIELRFLGRAVRAPVMVVPGHAPRSVALSLGWGRRGSEELARGLGTSAYALRARSSLVMGTGLEIAKTGARHDLPITQQHHDLHGRDDDILRHATRADLGASKERWRKRAPHAKRSLTLYHVEPGPAPHQWGMGIDLSICTGCASCVVACQAENNVPTVGADGVRMGRHMHWLRIDSYFVGDANAPDVALQPMLCQHCEMAPCEYVCPTNATVHSTDGLNQMVYNRCVGTRFCSNNCPYKVRRFNWFDYHGDESKTEQLVHNPDVTVRALGVME
ncbi:MAG: Molybdopterin oxidoreductase, iron-sulfur binding subunit [Labilithrix sp.]|nr:Molybdopterin oxidoreductase, iron-sulfur binding subunit [Labilithrix sp.]